MKKIRFFAAVIFAAALMASCGDDIEVQIPDPAPEPVETPDEVWIKDCPAGFVLGQEMHIYAGFNKEIPAGYRASLVSSDEKVLRVAPGTTGWDFYVTGVSLGSACLTLSYNGASEKYDMTCFQKVIPTITFGADYRLMFSLVPSDAEDAIEIAGRLYLEMDGKAGIVADYCDDRTHGQTHETLYDYQSVHINYALSEIPLKETFMVADLTKLKDYIDRGITSWYWDEALPRTGQPGYEDYRDDYEADYFELRYRFYDENRRNIPITFDFSQVKHDGWSERHITITQD